MRGGIFKKTKEALLNRFHSLFVILMVNRVLYIYNDCIVGERAFFALVSYGAICTVLLSPFFGPSIAISSYQWIFFFFCSFSRSDVIRPGS